MHPSQMLMYQQCPDFRLQDAAMSDSQPHIQPYSHTLQSVIVAILMLKDMSNQNCRRASLWYTRCQAGPTLLLSLCSSQLASAAV